MSIAAAAALADSTHDLFLSVASAWELAIKLANPKRQLILADPLDQYLPRWRMVYGLSELPIRTAHALELLKLPNHHRNSFDRILLAQAAVEGMTLVSGDGKFAAYPVSLLW